MRKRKGRRISSMTVIYIATIVSLSIMGIGYGLWSDELQVNVSITTGNIGIDAQVYNNGYGNLSIDVSDDKPSIYISGEIYRDFEEDITINIVDDGTVPFVLENISAVSTSEIEDLSRQERARYGLSSFIRNDVVETLQLSISAVEEDSEEESMMMQDYTLDKETYEEVDELQRKINTIQQEIDDIQREIDRLNIVEQYHFEYVLQFVQGI